MDEHKRSAIHYWYLLAAFLMILDQITKYLVEQIIVLGDRIPVNGIFNFVHLQNKGAAFSFLATAGGWQRYFFIGLAIGISIWLIVSIRRSVSKVEALGYTLVLGGALGNLSDRFYRGAVVDFLDFYWNTYHWPAFNIADITIVLGVSAMLYTMKKEAKPSLKAG
ncbi:MAG: signal peptidase II [Pseudomonadales bacterium]|nr:signal peptidase II [Pseudomonadales bacterium]MCG8314393.1 signal peptidase II [Pseudomonadales bacterium]